MADTIEAFDGAIRSVLDTVPVAIFVKDPDSRVILINRRCEEQWGIPLAHIAGTTGAGIIPTEQLERLVENDRRAFLGDPPGECEEVVWNVALQEDRTVLTVRHPVFDGEGKPHHLIGASVDITERKRLVLDLRESQEKLRGLFELSPLGIALTTLDGAYVEFNDAFATISGYSAEELRRLDYWALTPEQYAAQEREQLQQLLTHGHYGPYEKEYIRKDGSRVPLRLTGLLLKSAGGKSYIWSIVEDITAQKKAQEAVWYHANFDALTGLPNRYMFYARLEQEIHRSRQTGQPMALIFLDFDHFKEVNDAFGHWKGDLLLREAARRLGELLRPGDTAGRLSGDEFIVILGAVDDLHHVDDVARRILTVLSEPYRLGTELAHASASIGIAVFPEDGDVADELVRHADQAMYEAKALGCNRFRYFRKAMEEEVRRRSRIGQELRTAIDARQFCLFYQPIIGLKSGKVMKTEALLRWQHPDLGLVSPADFIPVAEQTGDIIAIGQWVFHEVVRQIQAWDRAGCRPIRVGINRSPVEFRQTGDALDAWARHLAGAGLSGERIVIEITEGLLVELSDTVRDQLGRLRQMGMALALDDFGTGYSSLAYLKKFDVDYLKIDRTFVQGVAPGSDDFALCEAMIVMAQKLGIEVIAEGIETPAQRDLLAAAGCQFGQGFLYCRPLPPDEFAAYLRRA